MTYLDCDLLGISYIRPDLLISSEQIEKDLSPLYERLKLPYGRIEMQTGIKTRGIFSAKLPSDIASCAAEELFTTHGLKREDIDLLIYASVCRDFLEPSTASVVHSNLKLSPSCRSFDLSNACLGVLSAIEVSDAMIKSGQAQKVMIVTGENSRPLIEKTIETLNGDTSFTRKSIKKYFANFTIGSAGVALVIGKAGKGVAHFNLNTSLSDTESHHLCHGHGSPDELVMETNSEELMQKGIALAKKNWNKFKDQLGQEVVDHYICHQVGIQHRNFMYQSLGLDLSKDHTSFERYGNTGPAALPLTLALAMEKKQFKAKEKICLLGIGSGLHTQMTELIWN